MTVLFGNTPAEYGVSADGRPVVGGVLALFVDAARTTRATGLTDEDGSVSDSSLPPNVAGRIPGSTVTTKANGTISFGAPDGTARLFYDRGDGVSAVIGPRPDRTYVSAATAQGIALVQSLIFGS